MHISYKPLWHTLLERDMRKEDLRLAAGMTTNMIANMSKEGKHISKDITDYDSYTETPYPDDIDTEHDGYVYLITENGERRFMNRADYEKWEAGIFTNKEPLTIPWQKITAANIDALVK